MPTPLKEPTLFVFNVRGMPIAAIAGKTRGEVERYIAEHLVTVARVNPLQAHTLGLGGLAIEYAQPEYDPAHVTGTEGEQLVQLPERAVDLSREPDDWVGRATDKTQPE